MKSEFDPATKTKIDRFMACLKELPAEACTYVIDSILAECLLKLRSKDALAEEITSALGADCVLVLIFKDGRYHLEAGHASKAPAAYIEILALVSDAITAVVSPSTAVISLSTPEESGSVN